MDNLCNRCGVCCRYIPADINNKLLFRDSIQPLTDEFESMLVLQSDFMPQCFNVIYSESTLNCDFQIFKCKYLLNDNVCSNPNKPQECKDFPSSPMAIIPDDCGYRGFQFLKHEDFKQKFRKMKEEILHYQALSIDEPQNERGYKKIIERLQAYINKYKIYGSEDW